MKSSMALTMLIILLVAGRVCCNDTTGTVTQPDCEVRRLKDHTRAVLCIFIVHCSVLVFLLASEYIL